jgi:hypothetical protein
MLSKQLTSRKGAFVENPLDLICSRFCCVSQSPLSDNALILLKLRKTVPRTFRCLATLQP